MTVQPAARRVLLLALGTRGDLEPFVRLGRRLQQEGYDVTVAVLADGARRVEGAGLRAAVVGPPAAQTMWSGSPAVRALAHVNPGLMWLQMRRALGRCAPAIAERLGPLLRRADAVLAGLPTAGVVPLLEAAGVPARVVLLAPVLPHPGGTATWSGAAWDRLPHPVEARRQDLLWRMTTELSMPLARALGMRATSVTDAASAAPAAYPPLLATSRVLDPHPAPTARATGWWSDPEPVRPLPAGPAAWLDAHPGSVLLALGSLPIATPARSVRRLVEVGRATGRPAVVQVAGARPGPVTGGYVVGDVDHRALLPRLAAAVHHGGSGTTHAVAAAGLPQVVVPHLGDQHHYGRQVHRTGLGPGPVPRALATRAVLTTRLQQALERPDHGRRAREAAAAMAREDGLGDAVRLVGAMVR